MQNKTQSKIYRLTLCGMLAALSVVLILLVRFPIIPAAPWLEYDAADIPVLIAAFTVHPLAGVGVLLVVSLIQGLFLGGSGIIGAIMHFIASGLLVLVAGYIYRHYKTVTAMIVGLILGSLCMTAAMIPLNLIFTPILFGTPVSAVAELIIPVLLPFNLIKAFGNSCLTLLIFAPSRKYLERFTKRLS